MAVSPAPLFGPGSLPVGPPALPKVLIQSLFPLPRSAGTSKRLNAGVSSRLAAPCSLHAALAVSGKWRPLPVKPLRPSVLSCSSFNLPDYIHGGPPGFAAVQRFTKTLTHPSSELAVPQPHMLRQLFPLILLSPCTPLPLWQGYCLFHSFLHISALAEAQLYLPPPGSSP